VINGQTVLAVIPARGGSKRAPRKNVRPFRGIPLILWSFAEGLKSRYIDTLICSTDDDEVKQIASKHLLFTIDRPAHLGSDTASNEDVLRHALSLSPHDWVVLLQPTSPLRIAEDIDACIEFAQKAARPVLTVRQDTSKNGAVYVATAKWLLDGHNFSEPCLKLMMPDERSLDIDYPEQFEEAVPA
jgi:CMP-N,N'-diacetyllegionaminic acid synthase